MTKKEYVERPATLKDSDYKIDVITIAPMKEIEKGEFLETTGKKEQGKEYLSKEITSELLQEGMVIIAQDTEQKQGIQH